MNHNKTRNTTINKILSVVIAILLWVFVIGEINPAKEQTFTGIPVQLRNLEVLASSNLAIAGTTDYVVDVKVRGQRSVIDNLLPEDIVAEADLFGYGQGQNYINVRVAIPENTELVEVRSQKIQVVIEELVAVSKPVRVEFVNVPEGKEIGGMSIQPADVEVSGAKSLVGSVASAFGRVDVTGYERGRSNTVQMELQPINDGEAAVGNVRMSSQYADVTYTVMDRKEVPLVVPVEGEIGADKVLSEKVVPETIWIRGTASALRDVEEITTEPVDVSRVADGAEVLLSPVLPEGIELARTNSALRGTFRFKTAASKTLEFTAEEIQLRNLPEGFEGHVAEGVYIVVVKGEPEAVEALDKESVSLSADAGSVQEETSVSLALTADCSVQMDTVSVEPETVEVVFRRTEE